jgi:hypothetical protein
MLLMVGAYKQACASLFACCVVRTGQAGDHISVPRRSRPLHLLLCCWLQPFLWCRTSQEQQLFRVVQTQQPTRILHIRSGLTPLPL